MRRQFKIGYLAVLLAGAAMFTSCITDEHLTGPGDGDGQREITFAVKVPGSTDATRALRETDETRITRVDVLVFEAGANGKFLYSAYAKDNGSNTYTVRLRESANSNEKFDVMMVANASSIISTAYSSGIPANTSRAEILQTLTYTLPADTPFPSMQSPTYTMPMWGMTEALLVNGSTTSKTIRLHRMVAKIDVGLDDAVTSSTFKLNSVRLYNYNQTGRLIPDPGNGNFTSTAPITEGDYTTYPKATAPSLKTGSTLTEGPVVYGNGEMTLTARKMEGAIYAFEASKGAHWDGSGGGDFTDNTCLVVGGFYGNQSSTETFYRIDFVKSNGTFLHLLRNHIYRVNIKSVSGAGFTSPEAAFQSRPVNITSEIIPWVDGEMTEVGFDGQYTLAISQNKYEFTAAGGTQTLTVKTDYPDGWTAKVCNASGVELTGTAKWVSPSPSSRSTAGEETITITAQPNTDIEDRPAYIHITAGRITLIIEVTQEKGNDKVYAAPGQIGIRVSDYNNLLAYRQEIEDPDALFQTDHENYFKLTIKGSSTYAAKNQNGNTLVEDIADNDFGGLEEEPVYALYFKWGSMVAMIGGQALYSSTVWKGTGEEVVWVHPDFVTANPNFNFSSYTSFTPVSRGLSDSYGTFNVNGQSQGDPCTLFGNGADNPLGGGVGQTWRTPHAHFDNDSPLGWYGTTVASWNTPTTSIDIGYYEKYSVVSSDNKIFLPSAGFRGTNGTAYNQGYTGIYWSSTANSSSTQRLSLYFSDTDVTPTSIIFSDYGISVRCVRDE